MFIVYILQSRIKENKYYIGFTSDLERRLSQHNSGKNRSTKPYKPWKIIYTEIYDTKKEAWLRERQIKSYKGGSALKKLIDTEGWQRGRMHRS